MKVRTLRRFNDDDFPNAEQWFLDFLNQLNPLIDTINPLFANNISIDDNMASERQTVTLSHGVPIKIKLLRLAYTPRLVRVGYAAGHVGVGAITSYNNDGTFYVTVYFLGTPPAVPVATTLVMEP